MQEVQRARILSAMQRTAAELGSANVTVADVVASAGVSRRTFYELFDNAEQCLLAAIEMALQVAQEAMRSSRDGAGGWREQVRSSLTGLLELFDEDPDLARLLILRWPLSDPFALERRTQTLRELAAAIDAGREEARNGGAHISPLAAEALVGAATAVIGERLQPRRAQRNAQRNAPLIDLVGPLMSLIVLPYLGPGAARAELRRHASADGAKRRARVAPPGSGRMTIRLTYRTLKVLSAVAAHPGASNRAIADAADIVDQGQASKLLARLQRSGLVENGKRKAASRGEPNAWRLTAAGEQMQRTLPAMR